MDIIDQYSALEATLSLRRELDYVLTWLQKHEGKVRQQMELLDQAARVGAGGIGPEGSTFKQSTKRKAADWAYIPINLHVQELRVKELNDLPPAKRYQGTGRELRILDAATRGEGTGGAQRGDGKRAGFHPGLD